MHSIVKYWLWLSSRRGIGCQTIHHLLETFQTPERLYLATEEELAPFRFSEKQMEELRDKGFDRVDKILGDCAKEEVRIMTYQDASYPLALRELVDAPLVLYLKGRHLDLDQSLIIAMVGAREPSQYGITQGAKLALELTHAGVLVVTGMAEGIDSACLQGALKAGGPVVSVVAGGVDSPFPPRSAPLYRDVSTTGLLISEYPPGTPHRGAHFPQRNRILSGLSQGLIVVESKESGGTMISANHALEQNRDLFALPGDIRTPTSLGPHRLMQQGAYPLTSYRDVLEYYRERFPLLSGPSLSPQTVAERVSDLSGGSGKPSGTKGNQGPKAQSAPPQPKPKEEEALSLSQQKKRFTDDQIQLLQAMTEPCSSDQLVELTQMPAKRVLSALTMLQIDGAVQEVGHRRFESKVLLEPT